MKPGWRLYVQDMEIGGESAGAVVSLGGHPSFLLDKLLADSSMTLLLCSQ